MPVRIPARSSTGRRWCGALIGLFVVLGLPTPAPASPGAMRGLALTRGRATGMTAPALAAEAASDEADALRQRLRALVQQARAEWDSPGIAVGVLHQGEPLLAEGFGYRDLAARLPVTPATRFAIGSVTKAFTATALGMLADEGRLDLDAPIRRHLPGFALQDPVAAAQASARDLLSHRTGLPRHDLVWYGAGLTREALFARLADLPPTAPFRSRFQYQNLMYMTAGLLLERLSGSSWERFLAERLFGPLGMPRTGTDPGELRGDPDHALPYAQRFSDQAQPAGPVRLPYRDLSAIGPAGGMHSSLDDLLRWVRFQLGSGTLPDRPDKALIAPATLAGQHAPQIVVSDLGTAEIPYTLYGLGWYIQPYRGETLLYHGGHLDGYTAMVALLPGRDSGLVILSNLDQDPLPTALMYTLVDRLIGAAPIDWHARYRSSRTPHRVQQQGPRQGPHSVSGTRPSHDLGAYTGYYHHPAFGALRIVRQGADLALRYRDLGGPLQHWHYDSFRLESPVRLLDGGLLSFSTDALGGIAALELSYEPETEPIRYARQPEPSELTPAALARFAGSYDLAGTPLVVTRQGQGLQLRVPGQPVHALTPYREAGLFRLGRLTGYFVRFEPQAGQVVAVELIQPDGVFRAVKR